VEFQKSASTETYLSSKAAEFYWKQRVTIRWITFGDAGTKFSMLMPPLGTGRI
jgi:hypothetical protein